MAALLARWYPDPKREKLKPGDVVIVIARGAGVRYYRRSYRGPPLCSR